MKLKVSIQQDNARKDRNIYHNRINAEDFKLIALIFSDLENFGLPIDKAIKQFQQNKKTEWDIAIGV